MKLFKLALALAVGVALLTSCSNQDSKAETAKPQATNTNSQEYNQKYNATFHSLDGEAIQLSDYQGKVVILDMWDTWCPPCRMEIPHFIELYDEYGDQGFEMVGLAFGREGEQAVRKFVDDYGINYTSGLMSQDIVAKFGQPRSIPTTYVIDQNGNIYKKYIGYKDKSVFENDIKTLLNM